MSRFLRKSTAAVVRMGPYISPTDGYTAATGATLVPKLAKAGGALAARSDATAIAHDADGYYLVTLGAGDTDTVGRLRVETPGAAGYFPVFEDFTVLDAAVYDVLFGSVAPSTHTAAAVQALVAAGSVASVAGSVGSVAAGVTLVANQDVRNVTGTIADKAGYSGTATNFVAPDNAGIAAIRAKTDNLPAAFPANFASLAITAGGAITAGTVTDKTGYALTTAYDAAKTTPPTASAIAVASAAAILADPTHPILTNASGYVTTSNPATGGSTVTDQTVADAVWANSQRTLTDKAGFGLADGAITSAKFGTITPGLVGVLERLMLLVVRWIPLPGWSVIAPKSGNGNVVIRGPGNTTVVSLPATDNGTTQTLNGAS